jgi:hypothetical protein
MTGFRTVVGLAVIGGGLLANTVVANAGGAADEPRVVARTAGAILCTDTRQPNGTVIRDCKGAVVHETREVISKPAASRPEPKISKCHSRAKACDGGGGG